MPTVAYSLSRRAMSPNFLVPKRGFKMHLIGSQKAAYKNLLRRPNKAPLLEESPYYSLTFFCLLRSQQCSFHSGNSGDATAADDYGP